MRAFRALTWAELKLFTRDPLATIFSLAFPLAMMLLLAAVFASSTPDEEENGELVFRGLYGDDYYVTASIGMVAAAIGLIVIPVTLTGYRQQGVLRRLRASGLSTRALFGAHLIVTACVTIVGTLLMLVAAKLVHGTPLPEAPGGVIVAFILAMLCFTAIGFLLAALIPTPRAAQGIGLILFFTVWLISGAGPPRAVLPSFLRDVGLLDPLTHVVIAIQDPWFDFGWDVGRLALLAAITVVAGALAVWRFRWS